MVTSISGDGQEPGAQEEKIFVAVRLRPMNEKEVAKNDNSDWECISKNTIIYKNGVTERSMYPNVYTFDRVYGSESTTKQVYEEGAKKTALSVLNGINSSIFAYGQTSSGKTYTMSGITKYAIRDLLDEISKQYDREFVVKFSAIEIYNECVRDLLSADGTPLRLLDDPEKGTVVDKLTEVKLIDWSHLMELLAVCEAQRQIGETSLNEMSSRSHQIIRLTVESTPIEFSGHHGASILTAIVNFVDLAGSERASQTLSAGARLKEGCHINRSLLTLGTVVRKLSKGRGGHVPYRDSKLTRILQNSLGGNAKTAIICTLSPAHTHLEQSRNTLLFATCAKEVRTNAQVNVVMSEKALVKQLQRELIRLENELKTIPATNDSSDVIKEKELQIEKMEREIKELQEERDQARTRLEEILRAAGIDERSIPRMDSNPIHQQKRSWDGHHASQSWMDPNPTLQHKSSWDALETSHIADPLHLDASINANGFPRTRRFSAPPNPYTLPNKQSINAPIDTFLPDKKRPNALVNTYSFPDKHDPQAPDDDQYFFDNISPRQFMNQYFGPDPSQEWEKMGQKARSNLVDTSYEVVHNENDQVEDSYGQMENVDHAESIQEPSPHSSSDMDITYSRSSSLKRSKSCRSVMENILSPLSDKVVVAKSAANNEFEEELSVRESRSEGDIKKLSRQDSQTSVTSVEEKEMEQNDDIYTLSPTSRTLQKVMNFDLKAVYEDYIGEDGTPRSIASVDIAKNNFGSNEEWSETFEKQRTKIIELWDECNIPLLHRTYFFLLIKGDPSDAVYIEVELRRLSFLKESVSHTASARSLNRERAMLARKLLRKFTTKEREALFEKWNIDLDSRQRRMQLTQLIWSKINDIEHAKDSAEIVAKLVGLIEPNKTPKELFALSFAPKQESHNRLASWINPYL